MILLDRAVERRFTIHGGRSWALRAAVGNRIQRTRRQQRCEQTVQRRGQDEADDTIDTFVNGDSLVMLIG
jgi:hypothetical protein